MRRNNLKRMIVLLCAAGKLLLPSAGYTYEVDTHMEMSLNATRQSGLQDFLQWIGFKSVKDSLSDLQAIHSIEDWIATGADHEDDTISTNFARYRNHFYDPQHGGTGYTYGLLTGEPSPDWALEDTRSFTTQSYSFRRARQYFYDALTLKDNREMWMARTFYTLGHIVHHIEDMAQPQHTRNDSHGGFILGPKSRYERYTDGHRGELPFSDQNYNATNPVRFDVARNFWTTGNGRGMAEFSSLNFLSAGTNFDTSLYTYPKRADAIAHDDSANDLLQSISVSVPPECQTPNPPCVMTFYTTRVNDNYRPGASADNPRASTESIFDQDLKANNLAPAFSLNRFNFDEAHKFLIPRAVAYSAGLIDYFFRGRLETEDAHYTPEGVSLRVRNAIDPAQSPAWANEAMGPGTLALIFDYEINGQKYYGKSTNVVDFNDPTPLLPGKTSASTYPFTLPPIPVTAQKLRFRVVFRGRLGQEDGAVAVGPATPGSGFALGGFSLARIGDQWTIKPAGFAGNIDWKGWYDENGTPTKVLSWQGPLKRYFNDSCGGLLDVCIGRSYSYEIYQNGERFSVAPGVVLGAALTRDVNGKDWLVAICLDNTDGKSDVVYRRPAKKSDPNDLHANAMYDPVNAPNGWHQVARFDHSDRPEKFLTPFAPWFFNGSGAEAQTMRHFSLDDVSHPNRNLARLKISIGSDRASISYLGNTQITAVERQTGPGCQSQGTPGDIDFTGTCMGDHSYTVNGEFVVAVDYDRNGELLGKVIYDAAGTDQVNATFVQDPTARTYSGSSFSKWKTVLSTARGSVVLRDRADSDEYSWGSGSGSETWSYQDSVTELDYLDLRTGLFVVSRRDSSVSASVTLTGSTSSGSGSSQWNDSAEARDRGEAHNIYSCQGSSSGPTSWYRVIPQIGDLASDIGDPYETVKTVENVYDVQRRQSTGNYGVDAQGNTLISIPYKDCSDGVTDRTFNYLTGGDLDELLGTGADVYSNRFFGVVY